MAKLRYLINITYSEIYQNCASLPTPPHAIYFQSNIINVTLATGIYKQRICKQGPIKVSYQQE
jgi:hypothetical protein